MCSNNFWPKRRRYNCVYSDAHVWWCHAGNGPSAMRAVPPVRFSRFRRDRTHISRRYQGNVRKSRHSRAIPRILFRARFRYIIIIVAQGSRKCPAGPWKWRTRKKKSTITRFFLQVVFTSRFYNVCRCVYVIHYVVVVRMYNFILESLKNQLLFNLF